MQTSRAVMMMAERVAGVGDERLVVGVCWAITFIRP